jgi:hypothetical protein
MATGTALSNYAENLLLNWLLTNGAVTRPTAWYVALFTADPGETGAGTEVTGGSYARQSVTFSTATTGSTSNTADILFPTATANWGTIVAVAIYDAATGGNELYYGPLTGGNQVINSGQQFKFAAGALAPALD